MPQTIYPLDKSLSMDLNYLITSNDFAKLIYIAREHYLRKDVPCHSEICPVCEQGK